MASTPEGEGASAATHASLAGMMVPLPAALLPTRGPSGQAVLEGPDGPTALVAWRIDALTFATGWDSGLGAEAYGGRWNPKGLKVVYCSLDAATCLVEAAVHRGFDVLDTQPHVLTHLAVDAAGVHVVPPEAVPNPAWLHGGLPSAGQQRFGAALLAEHGIVVLPSAVSRPSWNLLIAPDHAAGRWRRLGQQRLVVDTRLNAAA